MYFGYAAPPSELHPFFDSIIIFSTQSRHSVDTFIIYNIYSRGSYSQCCSGSIHSSVSTTYNKNLYSFVNWQFVTIHESFGNQFYTSQEMGSKTNAFQVTALYSAITLRDATAILPDRYFERLWLTKSRADKDSVKALCKEAFDSNIFSNMSIAVNHHSHLLDIAYLMCHDLFWQTIFGNAIAQNAATLCFYLEYLHSKSHTREVASHSNSRRSGSDNCYFSTSLFCYIFMCQVIV